MNFFNRKVVLDYTLLCYLINRYTFELYTSCIERKLAAAIRTAKLPLAGHVQDMEEELMPKRLLCATICAKKKSTKTKTKMAGGCYWRYKKKTAGNDVLEKSFRLRSVEKTSWKPIQLIICSLDDDDDNYDYK